MKMQRAALTIFGLLAGVVALSAGEGNSHEGVLKQMIGAIGKLGETLATVQDEDAGKSARPELAKGARAFAQARERAEKLPPPEPAEKERLAKLYKPKLEEA